MTDRAKRQTFKTEVAARNHAKASAKKLGLDLASLVYEQGDDNRWFYYVAEKPRVVDAEPVAAPASEAPAQAEQLDAHVRTQHEASEAAAEILDREDEDDAPADPSFARPDDAALLRVVQEPEPDALVTLACADGSGDYGKARLSEARDMADGLARSENVAICLVAEGGEVVLRIDPPAVDPTPEAPPAPDADAPPADAPPAPDAPAPDAEAGAEAGVSTPEPSAFQNPADPNLPALPEGSGYILRLRSRYDAKCAIMWAGQHARNLKVEVEVVHPETGEVVGIGRPSSRSRAATRMGAGSRRNASPTPKAEGEAKAPRVTRDGLAEKGQIPPAPTFGSEARQAKYGDKLAALAKVIETEDLAQIRAFDAYAEKRAGGYRALEGWRQQAIRALEARAATQQAA